jgi:hypothetical protein
MTILFFRFFLFLSPAEHIRNLGNDSVDIALLGPVSSVLMTREYGRRP